MFRVISEHISEKACREHRGKILFSAIVKITAPPVFRKIFLCLCTFLNRTGAPFSRRSQKIQGVQVNVMQNIQEVGITLDEDLLGTSLEQSSLTLVSLVEIVGIADVEPADEFREASVDELRY